MPVKTNHLQISYVQQRSLPVVEALPESFQRQSLFRFSLFIEPGLHYDHFSLHGATI